VQCGVARGMPRDAARSRNRRSRRREDDALHVHQLFSLGWQSGLRSKVIDRIIELAER
jgi:hypothetical protein